MERVVVTISSDLFDEVNQEASLRRNISVRTLIADTVREFSLPEANYSFRLANGKTPLDFEKTIDQLGIQTGAQLIFQRERRGVGRSSNRAASIGALSGKREAYIKAENGQIFEITYQPAIIGRPDAAGNTTSQSLAIDLSGFEEARSVSRRHASMTERNGNYFVESLSEHNLVQVNEDPVEVGERRRLADGDEILVGKIPLTFKLRGSAPEPTKSSATKGTQEPKP